MIPIVQFLRELIAIPSVNPAFLPLGDRRAGEKHIGDFLLAKAAAAGLEVDFQKVLPDRSNVLFRLAPRGKTRSRILLAPHLDTVGEPHMPDEFFSPVVKRGRILGRGACDTKGSVAVMFSALVELARRGHRPESTEILFAGLVDEENDQLGSRHFAGSGPKADLALVGEPTKLKVVTAHKGDVWLRLETRGRSAHGARPELGVNAVHAMARIVNLLETGYARQLSKRRHPLLGSPTVSVGMIEGGTQPNIVPAKCALTLDRRTIPGETEKSVTREILDFLGRHHERVSIASTKYGPCIPLETDPALPQVQKLMRAARQRVPAGAQFFCDAAVLAGGGIPSVVFGPGDIAQAHTAQEWISIRSLEEGLALLRHYLGEQP